MEDRKKQAELQKGLNPGKKKHKAWKIVLIVLLVILLIPSIFLMTVSIYHHTYSVDKGPETVANSTGLIQAEGRSLYDAGGKRIQLRGVNAGDAQVNEGWLGPWCYGYDTDSNGNVSYPDFNEEELREGLGKNPNLTSAQAAEIRESFARQWFSQEDFVTVHETLKMNAIRLPFYWRNLLNDDYSLKSDSEAFSYLDWFLGEAKANSLYVILDLHGCPHSQNGYEHSGLQSEGAAFWKNEDAQKAVVNLWKDIATHYTVAAPELGKTIASYDLLNEPTSTYGGKTDKTVWAVYDEIYDAIRETGDRHVITMEGCWAGGTINSPIRSTTITWI
jgi:endoglucanase